MKSTALPTLDDDAPARDPYAAAHDDYAGALDNYAAALDDDDAITLGFRSAALREACDFLSKAGASVGKTRRREVERIIASLADHGLRDVGRLALKAIVKVA